MACHATLQLNRDTSYQRIKISTISSPATTETVHPSLVCVAFKKTTVIDRPHHRRGIGISILGIE